MTRFILQLILVIAFSYASQFILPWWGVMIGSALATITIFNKALSSFFAGFLGLGALWFYLAYSIDVANQSLLSGKVAALFGLDNGFQMVLITALLGAIIGGFSALTGNYFIGIFKKTKINRSPYH
jgi:hypothetical protein